MVYLAKHDPIAAEQALKNAKDMHELEFNIEEAKYEQEQQANNT